ncbi:unnamed protein product [Spirodela intermedia]|uniref:Uncharacterized protein n=1 Tax=Spirodela intermedia TaxID=51605 RepID=A0A7I8J935_SPIIN|nr:unnamed protein product [Spirodela intermedia]CAA6665962.1 unnamed protein product [Spirodela intermedia]
MDSSEVAQKLVSPATAGSSHLCRVFSMAAAFSEWGSTERRLSMSDILAEEKGMELATERGRKAELDAVLVKCRFILDPGTRSFSWKKRATSALSWTCVCKPYHDLLFIVRYHERLQAYSRTLWTCK